jgi:hypothetical protein
MACRPCRLALELGVDLRAEGGHASEAAARLDRAPDAVARELVLAVLHLVLQDTSRGFVQRQEDEIDGEYSTVVTEALESSERGEGGRSSTQAPRLA